MFACGDENARMRILKALAFTHGQVNSKTLLPKKGEFQTRSNPLPMMFKYVTGAVAMQNIISDMAGKEVTFLSTEISRSIEGIIREKHGFFVVQKLLACCNGPALAPLFTAMCNSAGE